MGDTVSPVSILVLPRRVTGDDRGSIPPWQAMSNRFSERALITLFAPRPAVRDAECLCLFTDCLLGSLTPHLTNHWASVTKLQSLWALQGQHDPGVA